jgi:hypothetical protein
LVENVEEENVEKKWKKENIEEEDVEMINITIISTFSSKTEKSYFL